MLEIAQEQILTRVDATPIVGRFVNPVSGARFGTRIDVSLPALERVVIVMLCAGQDTSDIGSPPREVERHAL
jgi:hypothetical protein